MTEEPPCTKAQQHYWHELGREDNGETVYRCGNCLMLKYVHPDTLAERFEAAQA